MDARKERDKVVLAFGLGMELAQAIHDGLYSGLEVDDLGGLIGVLICQRVLRGEK